MKLNPHPLAVLALACFASTAHSQGNSSTDVPTDVPASPGAVSRVAGQFTGWFSGWDKGWDSASVWRVTTSPYTYHYSRDPNHTHVYMLGAEHQRADGFVLGGTLFQNSFGQPSAYLYVGQRFDGLLGVAPLFAHVTGGLLYGYREPYQNKVPLNYKGFSPGFVPSLGWQFTPVLSVQLNFLGNSALMFQFSADIR